MELSTFSNYEGIRNTQLCLPKKSETSLLAGLTSVLIMMRDSSRSRYSCLPEYRQTPYWLCRLPLLVL